METLHQSMLYSPEGTWQAQVVFANKGKCDRLSWSHHKPIHRRYV